MVAIPKFASTVILYRLNTNNNAIPFEILLIRRAKEMRFLGGVHAFPGGKLEKDDYSDALLERCKGLNAHQAHQLILDTQTFHQEIKISLGFFTTAIRELFEEVGLLFAYDKNLSLLNFTDPSLQQKYYTYRTQLLHKTIKFSDIIKNEDLTLSIDKLRYFRHFITPEFSPIRYDTRFFLAEIPPHQNIQSDEQEIISTEWGIPAKFLKRYQKKEIILIPPQFACLRSLKKVEDIERFCEALR